MYHLVLKYFLKEHVVTITIESYHMTYMNIYAINLGDKILPIFLCVYIN